MGGSIEAFRLFCSLESKNPTHPIANAQQAYESLSPTSTSTPASSATISAASDTSPAQVQNLRQPIKAADPTSSHAVLEKTTLSDDVVTAADAEAGVLLSQVVSPSGATAGGGDDARTGFSASSPSSTSDGDGKTGEMKRPGQGILAQLLSNRDTNAPISTAADAEAGTALTEVFSTPASATALGDSTTRATGVKAST